MVDGLINFNQFEITTPIIKVIGVGGGGGNAVEYMYRQGICDVDFVLCNTDSQILEHSPIPTIIQLGKTLTEGRGAGNRPEIGEAAANESIDDIKALLSTNTKMVFITAAMGGGYRDWCGTRDCQGCQGYGYSDGGYCYDTFPFRGPETFGSGS